MKTREKFVEKLKTKIDEWNSDINKIERRLKAEQTNAKVDMETQVAALREKRDRAMLKLNEVQNASSDSWDTLKIGAQKFWDDLNDTLSETKESFLEGLHGRK